jgi:type IV pilus assembly protein PilE
MSHDTIDPVQLHASASRLQRRRFERMAGITLLELMVVTMIIGILGIIAMPSYRQYSMRAQRVDAKNALLRLQANQERFYLQNRRYGATADLAALGFAVGKSEKGAYAITVTNVNNQFDYTATATVTTGGQIDQTLDTECQTFSINQAGLRTATPDPQSRCW